jgi:membrane protease YdiL (CAAX protease family)
VIPKQEIGILFLTGVLMNLFFSAALSFLPQWMLGSYTQSTQNVLGQDTSMLSILSLAIAAPLTEEIVFRGFLLRGLEREFSAKTAVLAVSLLFGVTHIYPIWIAYAAICGLALSWFAVKWDNLLASVIVHIAFNTASLPQLILPKDSRLYQALYENDLIIFVYLILAAGSLYLLYRLYYSKKGEQPHEE